MYLDDPHSSPPCGQDDGTNPQTATQLAPQENSENCILGLSAQNVPLREETRLRYGLTAPSAVLAVSIDPASLAGQARLQHGDLIIGLSGHPVSSIDDMERILQTMDADGDITFRIIRLGRELLLGSARP
jgi:S1-C subfamily serine protease